MEKIPVIYYHSIAPPNPQWNRSFLSLEPRIFEKHIKYLKTFFNIIDLHEYWAIRNGVIKGPKNPLVLNFDDGFLDNWIWAFPILKKYSVKATIFINPEMVDKRDIVRLKTKNQVSNYDYKNWGYLSWAEINLMVKSGLVDIQSHTMSHTKYFISGKLIDFHHPGADCLYPIGNIYPDLKPYHIGNLEFERKIKYGTPFFEEKSAVIAKIVTINPDFINECVLKLKNYNFSNYSFNEAYNIVKELYNDYIRNDNIIIKKENDREYRKRLNYEIVHSKKIIEEHTGRKVEYLCWPHGDNNNLAHTIAIKAGYKATTSGKTNIMNSSERIEWRIGISLYKNSELLGLIKAFTKIAEYRGNYFAKIIKYLYNHNSRV